VKRVLFCATVLAGIPACSPSAPNPEVMIDTSMGKIKVELYQDKAPITVKNFLRYVDEKHYDGTIFHRVIPDFMIQGGGFEPGMKERKDTHAPIENESSNDVANVKGTLAMARTNAPNSATDQFFINVKDNEFLNRAKAKDGVGYAVFGKVLTGTKPCRKRTCSSSPFAAWKQPTPSNRRCGVAVIQRGGELREPFASFGRCRHRGLCMLFGCMAGCPAAGGQR
jgi:cyclophilin family peptidyl-prolyl cis-trans isomerase